MIIDFHCDTLSQILKNNEKLKNRTTYGHVDIQKLKKAKILGQAFAVFTSEEPGNHLKKALEQIDLFYRELEENRDDMILATRYEDFIRAEKEDKIAAMLSLEGGECLEGSLANLRIFYKLGVRMITLTWNRKNEIADGIGEDSNLGLTPFGKEVVKEMNRLGMIIDVSHLSEKGFYDVLEVSEFPTVASHSNCRAICPNKRNLSDEQIKALSQKGGVIGLTFVNAFVDEKCSNMDNFLRHLDHAINLVGVEHVAFGSDFDGCTSIDEMKDISCYALLIENLIRRGYKDTHLNMLLRDNWLRIIKEVIR